MPMSMALPQGIDFLLKVVEANERNVSSYIIIVGSGTEYPKIAKWFEENTPRNAKLIAGLPKNEYDQLIRACHVGLIFLDPRFTIPNFPSRLLSYLENSMPVLLATDKNTDMGSIAEQECFGLWSESGDLPRFLENMSIFTSDREKIKIMGKNGKRFLLENYTVESVADKILYK